FKAHQDYLLVEAEKFNHQELDGTRKWYIIDTNYDQSLLPDPDESHASTAEGNAYLEILPDTRTTHDDQLIVGENFSNEPGKMAVLHYDVDIATPGKYYVWVKAYSTGTEDNGIHVGLDGEWVASGQRMQWCEGKNAWTWASKQRTEEQHCGVEKYIFLHIKKAGQHTISFSMREDGFEFDQWMLTKEYAVPSTVSN
ncbi:MAG: hypothetical protein AAFU67_16460, partial [Bacteroidota bacterium]